MLRHLRWAALASALCPATLVAQNVLRSADSVLSERSRLVGVPNAVAGLADADVVYLGNGLDILRGLEVVRRAIAADTMMPRGITLQPVRAGLSADSSFGYTYGYYVGTAASAGGADVHGKYIDVWRRIGSEWRLAALVLAAAVGPLPAPLAFTVASAAPPNDAGSAASAMRGAMRADSLFCIAAEASIAEAFAAYAAPDAAILSGEPDLRRGREAIRANYSELPASTRLVWGPVAARAATSGDLAFTTGNATLTWRDDKGADRTSYSKYLTVWRKQPDGSWKYIADGGSRRPAPAPAQATARRTAP